MTPHVVVEAGDSFRCLHCGERHVPRLPMPIKTHGLVAKGFALMHESCPKPVEPSKQTELFDALAKSEPEKSNGHGRPGNGYADPAAFGLVEVDPEELASAIEADAKHAWAIFDRRWPAAHDAAALHGDLATAMQGIGTPSAEEIRKHPPESATFQQWAHWARLKIAHMNHSEYPDLWLPDLGAMPEALAQRVKPRRKASVRPPLTSKSWKPKAGKRRTSVPSR
jgi:hypothetical protein